MNFTDTLTFASASLRGARTRTLLMMLAMSIGVAAGVVLTALGEGARRYVVGQFSSLGSNLVIVLPGRSETAGVNPGMLLGQTSRDLVLEDAQALLRSPAIRRIAPLTIGAAQAAHGSLNREVVVMGTTANMLEIRHMDLAQGRFLPQVDPRLASPVCVLGATIKKELFGSKPAIGAWLRLGDRRYRVVGVLAEQGESMGMNSDELVIIPVASAHMLFNSQALFRILVEAKNRDMIEVAKHDAEQIIKEQHGGELDVTVITQDAVLATFDRILRALTLTVASIAAISHRAGRKPAISRRKPPAKKPRPFIAFFDPVNHATQRNNCPASPSEIALMADLDAVLVRSLATPAIPCAVTTQTTDAVALQPG